MSGIPPRVDLLERGNALMPAALRARPRLFGKRRGDLPLLREHEHEIVLGSGPEFELHCEHLAACRVAVRDRACRSEPAEVQLSHASAPRAVVVAAQRGHGLGAEFGAEIQHDLQSRDALLSDDPAQDDGSIRA